MNHYTTGKSSVFAAALDLSKAFDRVLHSKLIVSLLNAGIPIYFIAVLADWYAKLNAAVRWNNTLSSKFHVNAGVRQGSVLSPSLFDDFINVIIVKLRETQCGCHINGQFFGLYFICRRQYCIITISTRITKHVEHLLLRK